MPSKNPRLSVVISPALAATLTALAEETGESASGLVRGLLDQTQPALERMLQLVRAAKAAKGNISGAKAFAESKFGEDTRLQNVMKAAVEAGTTTNPTWAGALVDYRNLSSEFVDFLRPATILGQFGQGGIPSLRRVPFNVRIPGKTAAGVARWVGEGARKPVTSSGYSPTEFKFAKVAGISVITGSHGRVPSRCGEPGRASAPCATSNIRLISCITLQNCLSDLPSV